MVEPRRMVQVDSTETNSPWAPVPVDIEGGGGGGAPGPDGVHWESEDGQNSYSLSKEGAEGYTSDASWAINPGWIDMADCRLWVPDSTGVIATREWVQAQIAAALA